MIFHLALGDVWREARRRGGPYEGSTADRSLGEVGFVHCSYSHQLRAVADEHYSGRDDLVLLAIDPSGLDVRAERPPGAAGRFPHLFGPLPLASVVEAVELGSGSDGRIDLGALEGPLAVGELALSGYVVVERAPEAVYDLVADVTRTGEWSPVCTACWWDEGQGPYVGARFTGRNETPERTWETRSEVVAATRGETFAFVVGGGFVRWSFLLEPVASGTELTEAWEFLPAGLARFAERYGEHAAEQVEERTLAARDGIPRSLAALKRIAESG